MPEEGFLKRWSRLKATGEVAEVPDPLPAAPIAPDAPALAPLQADAVADKPLPTLADAARLTPDADFSSFVAKDVDKSVQRLALKKLFADPHFHVMDGLDMYMDDYNKPSPVSAAMLAALDHARSALRHPDRVKEEAEAAAALRDGGASAALALDTDACIDAHASSVGAAAADADNVSDQRNDNDNDNDGATADTPPPAPTQAAMPRQPLQGQA